MAEHFRLVYSDWARSMLVIKLSQETNGLTATGR